MIGTLQDVFRDMESGVYDYTKDGKCIGCGKCCSNFLPLSQKEIKAIRQYVRKHNIKEHRHLPPTLEEPIDMTCPFLDESKQMNKCDIYEVRPQICRVFMCNQPPSKIKGNKEMFMQAHSPCDMRKTFFGQ